MSSLPLDGTIEATPREVGGRGQRWRSATGRGLGQLATAVVTVLASAFIVTLALSLAPGSALSYLSGGQSLTPAEAAELTEKYHLDQPVIIRYFNWLGDMFHGDFGVSLFYRSDVADLLATRLPTTALLVGMAAVLMLALGIGMGLWAGLSKPRTDGWITAVTSTLVAIPPFVLAVVLLAVFAVWLPIFPALGSGDGFLDKAYHLVLPAIALGIGTSAAIARTTRASIRTERGREYVDTAVVRGLPRHIVIRRHVLRNALIPIVTTSGLAIAALVSGTLVVETAFNLDGIGSLLVQGIQQKDFAVVQSVTVILIVVFIAVTNILDVLYRVIDPRVGKAS